MRGQEKLLQRIVEGISLPGETIPGQTVVEIGGDNRILVENYCAIREYSPHQIEIRVKYGTVTVKGTGMELRRMTREQLVISGKIDGVMLQRGN